MRLPGTRSEGIGEQAERTPILDQRHHVARIFRRDRPAHRLARTIAGHVRTIFCRWNSDAPSFEAIAHMILERAPDLARERGLVVAG